MRLLSSITLFVLLVVCSLSFSGCFGSMNGSQTRSTKKSVSPDPGECKGNYKVTKPMVDGALLECTRITGSLTIHRNVAVSALIFPKLQSVGGRLLILTNEELTSVSLPALVSVGSDLRIEDNKVLKTLELPVLSSVGKNFGMEGNNVLVKLELPSLTEIGGSFDLGASGHGYSRMPTISLPQLGKVGGTFHLYLPHAKELTFPSLSVIGKTLSIDKNKSLTSFEFPKLTHVHSLTLRENKALVSVNLPQLVSVVECVSVYRNGHLQAISLPRLSSIGHGLSIDKNPSLRTIDMPVLVTVGKDEKKIRGGPKYMNIVYVNFNNALTEVAFPSLSFVSGLKIHDNKRLSVVKLPALTTVGYGEAYGNSNIGKVMIGENAALTAIELPVLKRVVNEVSIGASPLLSTCALKVIRNKLLQGGYEGRFHIYGTNDAAKCQ